MHVAAEVGPYVSVGGLSQVLYFLPKALRKLGVEARVFTCKFGTMDNTAKKGKKWKFRTEHVGLAVPTGSLDRTELICNVKSITDKDGGVKTYFLENREYYELRANVFGYKDDHIRFALLSKGVLEWLRANRERKDKWWPDLIHCHDWHAAYLIEMARVDQRYKELLHKIPIVLTVHNFTYQGNYDYRYCEKKDVDRGKGKLLPIFDQRMQKQNALLRGIMHADAVTTVSKTHAREVLTEEYGEGLDQLMKRERAKVSGILNGLDTEEFDPQKDPLIFKNFGIKNFVAQRKENKRHLQELFGLPKKDESFLMAFSGRLTNQKGLGLLIEAMQKLLPEHEDVQFVILGGGDDSYRRQLSQLARDYPKQVGLHLMPNFRLPRKIFSGADAFLIPSLFEPGGIVALEALRYGAIPIVRRTGGLNDIVEEYDQNDKTGNGFSFSSKNAWSLYGAIIKAKTIFENKSEWKRVVLRALKSDFSWIRAAKDYAHWYRTAKQTRKKLVKGSLHVAYKSIKS